MNLTIKGLPAKVRDSLMKSARTHGRSLNDEIIQILHDYMAPEERRERRRNKELDAFFARLIGLDRKTAAAVKADSKPQPAPRKKITPATK